MVERMTRDAKGIQNRRDTDTDNDYDNDNDYDYDYDYDNEDSRAACKSLGHAAVGDTTTDHPFVPGGD
jgi:hypothetical protein